MTDKPMTPAVAPSPGEMKLKKSNKWLVWGLVGFTGILLVTAVILFVQLRKPAAPPLPSPRPAASVEPVLPPVKEIAGEAVCEMSFSIEELECTDITVDPSSTSVVAGETRELTAEVTGGAETYSHAWTISTTGSLDGSLSATTDSPVTWTAPSNLTESQEWTITDRVTDGSTTTQEDECSVTLRFTGLSACFDTCEIDADCEDNLSCMSVSGDYRCVDSDCPSEVDCACDVDLVSCNNECTADAECEGDLRCIGGACLNAECTEEVDCACDLALTSPPPKAPKAPPEPEVITKGGQPELPEAGVATPAVLGASIGILLVILGLLVL